MLILNWLYNGVADFHDLPRHWHRDLAKVLSGSDPQAADAKIRQHVRYALDDVLQRLEAAHLQAAVLRTFRYNGSTRWNALVDAKYAAAGRRSPHRKHSRSNSSFNGKTLRCPRLPRRKHAISFLSAQPYSVIAAVLHGRYVR